MAAELGPELGTEPLMAAAVRLGASVDTLAALAAYVRLETEQLPADPAVREILAAIAAQVLGAEPTAADAAPAVGLARTFLRQATELVENPGRSGGWDQVDVPLLQAIGRMSGAISGAVLAAGRHLPVLGAALATPGARFLDIGTGTGWFAIAMARTHPTLSVVGLDLFEPALNLARSNIEQERLDDRVELRLQDAVTLDEPDGYDAIWLPLPFLPREIVPAVMAAAARSLKPGGWVLPGTFTGPTDPLSELLTDLRTVRSGGYPWRDAELLEAITSAGFADAEEIPRTWPAPVRLYAGRRA